MYIYIYTHFPITVANVGCRRPGRGQQAGQGAIE